MCIVTNEGVDIPYFGIRYPKNEHAMRLVDPIYVPSVGFVSVVDEDVDGDVGVSIPYEIFKDLLITPNVEVVPLNDNPFHILGQDARPEEYIWTMRVTRAVAEGRNVLVRIGVYVIVLIIVFWFVFISYYIFVFVFYW